MTQTLRHFSQQLPYVKHASAALDKKQVNYKIKCFTLQIH